MPRRRRGPGAVAIWAVVIGALLIATAAGPAPQDRPRERLQVPSEVTKFADEWPVAGHDHANTRTQTRTRISRANVASLEAAWSVEIPGVSAYGNLATVPLIADGVVYVQDLLSNVRAIDLATGQLRWQHEYRRFQIGPNGPALGYGNVYVAAGPRQIAALDAATGEEKWSTQITATSTDGVSIQPTVVDGLVLAATVPVSLGEQFAAGDRGILWALDAETGEKVWTFDTVKSKDLWGHPELNSGGGAWYTPAVDVERGLVYWGTANPAPFVGTPEFPNGSSRPGPNLYTNSVVALHVRTGKLAWYHQSVPHDLFDRDLVLAAIGTIEDADGDRREVVVGSGKGGRILSLDPRNGKKLGDTPVGEHRNDDLTELQGPTEVLPGLFGGVETPLATADGVVYAAVLNSPSVHSPDRLYSFADARVGVMRGEVAAVELASGDVLWRTKVDGDPLGGATVVGNLIFTATYQGALLALDRKTGEIVWSAAAPGGVNGQPAVAGDTIVWPVGVASPASLVAYRLPSATTER